MSSKFIIGVMCDSLKELCSVSIRRIAIEISSTLFLGSESGFIPLFLRKLIVLVCGVNFNILFGTYYFRICRG